MECKKMKSCRYGGKMGGIPICNYLSLTGKRRPCPPDKCTEYKRGKNMIDRAAESWRTMEEKDGR